MASELKKFEVTDNQDNNYEIDASQFCFDEGWVKFYDGPVIVAAFLQPAGFVLIEE